MRTRAVHTENPLDRSMKIKRALSHGTFMFLFTFVGGNVHIRSKDDWLYHWRRTLVYKTCRQRYKEWQELGARVVKNSAAAKIVKMVLTLFSSHRKNLFAARCECLHLIKKNSQWMFARCEFFLIRSKYSQQAASFLQ